MTHVEPWHQSERGHNNIHCLHHCERTTTYVRLFAQVQFPTLMPKELHSRMFPVAWIELSTFASVGSAQMELLLMRKSIMDAIAIVRLYLCLRRWMECVGGPYTLLERVDLVWYERWKDVLDFELLRWPAHVISIRYVWVKSCPCYSTKYINMNQ